MLDWIADQTTFAVVGALMPVYDFLIDGTSRYLGHSSAYSAPMPLSSRRRTNAMPGEAIPAA